MIGKAMIYNQWNEEDCKSLKARLLQHMQSSKGHVAEPRWADVKDVPVECKAYDAENYYQIPEFCAPEDLLHDDPEEWEDDAAANVDDNVRASVEDVRALRDDVRAIRDDVRAIKDDVRAIREEMGIPPVRNVRPRVIGRG